MNEKLAKQLKDAGFPHPFRADAAQSEPSLSELIEACGDEFVGLRNFRHELWRTYDRKKGDGFVQEMYGGLPDGEWIADSTRAWASDEGTAGWNSTHGLTPEEAVARLYLSLYSPK